MKKRWVLLTVLLAFLCFFPACGKKTGGEPLDGAALADEIKSALHGEHFNIADEDFIRNRFPFTVSPAFSFVAFSDGEHGVEEFGVFAFSGEKEARAEETAVRAYLKEEEETLEATLALYPREGGKEDLDRYRNATVKVVGATLVYAIFPPEKQENINGILSK